MPTSNSKAFTQGLQDGLRLGDMFYEISNIRAYFFGCGNFPLSVLMYWGSY